mmetsp:Transcript_26092/g.34257  ORF Transcript_26092/g.34257 Transcript_26092/m.34257 type:complete len:696 (+) Transcript_26092:48-2135(+)
MENFQTFLEKKVFPSISQLTRVKDISVHLDTNIDLQTMIENISKREEQWKVLTQTLEEKFQNANRVFSSTFQRYEELCFSADTTILAKNGVNIPAVKRHLVENSCVIEQMLESNPEKNFINLDHYHPEAVKLMSKFCTLGDHCRGDVRVEYIHDLVLLAIKLKLPNILSYITLPTSCSVDLLLKLFSLSSLNTSIEISSTFSAWHRFHEDIYLRLKNKVFTNSLSCIVNNSLFGTLSIKELNLILSDSIEFDHINEHFTVQSQISWPKEKMQKVNQDYYECWSEPCNIKLMDDLSFAVGISVSNPNTEDEIVEGPFVRVVEGSMSHKLLPNKKFAFAMTCIQNECEMIIFPQQLWGEFFDSSDFCDDSLYHMEFNEKKKIGRLPSKVPKGNSMQHLADIGIINEITGQFVLSTTFSETPESLALQILCDWAISKQEIEGRDKPQNIIQVCAYVEKASLEFSASWFNEYFISYFKRTFEESVLNSPSLHALSRNMFASVITGEDVGVESEISILKALLQWAVIPLDQHQIPTGPQPPSRLENECLWGYICARNHNFFARIGKVSDLNMRNSPSRSCRVEFNEGRCAELFFTKDLIIFHDISELLPLVRFPFISQEDLSSLRDGEKAYLQHLSVGKELLREARMFQSAPKAEQKILKPKQHPVTVSAVEEDLSYENQQRKRPRKHQKYKTTCIPEVP